MEQHLKTSVGFGSSIIYRFVDSLIILNLLPIVVWHSSPIALQGYLALALGAALLFGMIGRFTDIYASWSGRPFWQDEVVRLLVTWLATFLLVTFTLFAFAASAQFDRSTLLIWLFSTPILLVASRYSLRTLTGHLKRLGVHNRLIAIAGITERGLQFAETLNNHPETGLVVVGFYSLEGDKGAMELPPQYKHIGAAEELVAAARYGEWDQIYLAPPQDQSTQAMRLLRQLADSATPICLLPDPYTHTLLHSRYVPIAGIPVLKVYDAPLSTQGILLKRLLDIALGTLILAMASPLFVLIALAIKLDSPGPVLFRQTRHGLRGEMFQVLKFRTMTVCEDGEHIQQATRNDRRVTRVGTFLRRTSLDELPQFINVLQGHMSIVGPRPHAVAHNEQYRKLIPGYMQRHLVKPGITGWAQVNGWRGETDTLYKMQKRVEFDMEYIQRWSLALDLRIIALTAVRMFADKNAY